MLKLVLFAFFIPFVPNKILACDTCLKPNAKEHKMTFSKTMKNLSLSFSKTEQPSKDNIVVDATPDFGGNKGNFNPGDLLAGSLSSCMMINMKSALNNRNLKNKIHSKQSIEIDKSGDQLKFNIVISFDTDAPNDLRPILEKMIDACPYKKALNNNVDLNVILNTEVRL